MQRKEFHAHGGSFGSEWTAPPATRIVKVNPNTRQPRSLSSASTFTSSHVHRVCIDSTDVPLSMTARIHAHNEHPTPRTAHKAAPSKLHKLTSLTLALKPLSTGRYLNLHILRMNVPTISHTLPRRCAQHLQPGKKAFLQRSKYFSACITYHASP